ncbi:MULTISPECIES: hypothetical protein [unclassified Pseudomonas]|uniref:hypothetical protein n=1 Tax=unclassified Pseudomonas TaxID=196821 RepID=UPI002097BCF9|nr:MULTISPECIES: hypothetical protein [unclassified Pseudomonas]MCO7520003.1 hypothetical protein [Pseudomonas sp. 1]MCO7540982.1 hypothetical protein [Pseudomonas sp. VA159-2]
MIEPPVTWAEPPESNSPLPAEWFAVTTVPFIDTVLSAVTRTPMPAPVMLPPFTVALDGRLFNLATDKPVLPVETSVALFSIAWLPNS